MSVEPDRAAVEILGRARAHVGFRSAAGLAAILTIVFGSYARILGYWFVSDDFWYLRAAQIASVPRYILDSFDYTTDGPVPEFVYRPLYAVAFLLTYKLFGLNAWPYHLLSILVHMLNTALVWLIAKKLTRRPGVAHIAAFIFGLHPSYAVTIAWITSNVNVFAMVFSLGAVLFFFKYLDGGPRRWLHYAASFLSVVVALLIHPESAAVLATLVTAYLLWCVTTRVDLKAPRLYLPIVPHLLLGIAFFRLLQSIRDRNYYQRTAFAFGWHMLRKYLAYVARAGNPFGAADDPALHWGAAIAIVGVGLTAAYALFSRRFDFRSRTLVIVWLALAILPLTTFNLGIQSRKLYAAGPPFALMVAMAAVAGWDSRAARSPASGWRATRARLALSAAALLAAVGLPLRTWQVIDRPHMAEASLTKVDDQTYKSMVEQVREVYPRLPDGARLQLGGVPWPLLVLHVPDPRLIDAIKLYYGDIEVAAYNPLALPLESPGPFFVQFTCPPVCGPPAPPGLIEAVLGAVAGRPGGSFTVVAPERPERGRGRGPPEPRD